MHFEREDGLGGERKRHHAAGTSADKTGRGALRNVPGGWIAEISERAGMEPDCPTVFARTAV